MNSVRDADVRGLKFQILADDLRRSILAGIWTPGSRLPTEQQLAAETGFSLTTIRRALDELVALDLVVRRQGSGTFVAEPALRTTDSRRTVGLLLPSTSSYYPRVLQGVEEALRAAGASLRLATYSYDEAAEDGAIRHLLDAGVDGLVLVPTLDTLADPVARVAELARLTVPVVLLERSLVTARAADESEHVCSDHEGGAYDAVTHLHRLGHTRIAVLTRVNAATQSGVVRGARQALEDLGLEASLFFEATNVVWESDRAGGALAALRRMRATAALVFGDREAALLEGAARRRGMQVPDDLALVSYDDETADLAEVPLTAVSPAKYALGRTAADVLLRRLREGDACPLHQIRLRPRLVVRESCGAQPGGIQISTD